jgi:3-oxoadipate enol-lactonase
MAHLSTPTSTGMSAPKSARGKVLDVITTGQGPDLVLLHSLLIDRSAYHLVVPALARTHRVHLVALPGFDGSSPMELGPPGPSIPSPSTNGPSIEDYADRVAAGLRALKLGRNAALLGNGFGGFVATSLALRHPKMFRHLLLIDTAAGFPESARVAFRTMAERVASGGMEAIVDLAARRIFHGAYLAAHPEAYDQRRATLRKFDPTSFVAACRALERLDLTSELAKIKQRTLVVVGELDAATPVGLAQALASGIPGAEYVQLPQCGHCPPLEQPEVFLKTVEPFLAAA